MCVAFENADALTACVTASPVLMIIDVMHSIEACNMQRLHRVTHLQLGIHHEGPALRVGEDGAVLHRGGVTGQPLPHPAGYSGIIHQHLQGVRDASGHGSALVRQELDPFLDQLCTELGGEGAGIAHKGCC